MPPSIEHYLKSEFPHIVAKPSLRARRFTLRFDPKDQKIMLSMPPQASLSRLQKFLQESTPWVQKILTKTSSLSKPLCHEIDLFGKRYRLVYEARKITHIWQTHDTIFIYAPADRKKKAFESWLQQKAKLYFSECAQALALKLNVSISKITIKDTRSRWGSCSHEKTLSFSWRLIFAPLSVSYYVCAHEVAHLKEMNHSPTFWRLVSILDPDHQQARRWLKENGASLFYFNAENL